MIARTLAILSLAIVSFGSQAFASADYCTSTQSAIYTESRELLVYVGCDRSTIDSNYASVSDGIFPLSYEDCKTRADQTSTNNSPGDIVWARAYGWRNVDVEVFKCEREFVTCRENGQPPEYESIQEVYIKCGQDIHVEPGSEYACQQSCQGLGFSCGSLAPPPDPENPCGGDTIDLNIDGGDQTGGTEITTGTEDPNGTGNDTDEEDGLYGACNFLNPNFPFCCPFSQNDGLYCVLI